jgi:uncharacterized OB-fold protein
MQNHSLPLFRHAADGTMHLLLARCSGCGDLTFPASTPGCRACGCSLDESTVVEHSGTAKLLDFVRVHVEIVPGLRVPYLAAEIEVIPGLVIGAALADRPSDAYRLGMALIAQADPQAGADAPRCLFAPHVEVAR